jgi:hypothetical protein
MGMNKSCEKRWRERFEALDEAWRVGLFFI